MDHKQKQQCGAVEIAGTGRYLPERVMTNADLEQIVDTTDEWIYSRTGMKERRIARDDEATSDMASAAARPALEQAGLAPEDLELIVVATITPDQPWPNTACFVQHHIGAAKAACIGLEAACSGFLYALETARNFIAAGSVNNALVIGAEKMSSILDWEDRTTCVLFGDGAGAAVLRPASGGRGILSTVMGSDGSLSHLLGVPGGGSRIPVTEEMVRQRLHFLKMEGREVYKHAVNNMVNSANRALEKAGLTSDGVQWVIPHQANLRIIRAVSQRLGIGMDRFIVNVESYGNTSGASIPIALDEAARDRRIRPGDIVLLVVFGGGFTWGSMIMVWGDIQ